MGQSFTHTEHLPVRERYQIIVVGGGVAGCAAAIQAAKNGKSVLLLEKTNLLGGLATIGLVNYFVPMCNGNGKQVIYGLCDKWFHDSIRYGFDTVPAPWRDGEPKQPTTARMLTNYSPYLFAMLLTEEVQAAGVHLLYDVIGSEPVMEGKVCTGVITESKGGREYFPCDMLIDTTGDADLLRRSGIPTVAGKNFYTYLGKMVTLASCKKAVEQEDIRYIYEGVSGGGINLYGHGQPADIPQWSGLTAAEVTDYLVRNQMEMLKKLKEMPPHGRELVSVPTMPNFRTTCHLAGDYALRETDQYRHFADSVCVINDFDRRHFLYEVPLRCLCRSDYPNLLTAGRSASGEGYGWDLLRVIPPAILTGQAAAEAACLALDSTTPAAQVDIATLQKRLEKSDIMIHFPDEWVPSDKELTEMANEGHV